TKALEEEGCGPEGALIAMPEAQPDSPPAPPKPPVLDLFNLVLFYKRLVVYLEPLKDAFDGILYLLRFYGLLLGSIFVLYLLPLCWILALLNSTLFLGNVEFYRVVAECRATLQQRMNPQLPGNTEDCLESDSGGRGVLLDCSSTPTPTEDLTPGSVEEAEEAEPDEEFKDAIEEDEEGSACSVEDDLALHDNGFMSKNEVIRSKVSRLTEKLRKRYPTNNFGNCASCSATFSVLKKRRSCSNCGNSFCSRCCSFKVLKSSMGATAPEAQRETVFVCGSCNQNLSK
uniref:Protrudin n=1 Tax=Monodelphis domestica TaxID=13616 RepID=A0A5F8GHS2_MONDO